SGMVNSPENPLRSGALLSPLTPREHDVLRLLAEGLTNSEIAEALVLSTETVRWYTKQLYSKLGVHHRVKAVAQARALGLVGSLSEADATRPTIPLQTTSFVGRTTDMAQI